MMKPARFRRLAPASLLTLAILTSTLTACSPADSESSSEADTDYQPGTVVRVIDGDTLVINFDGADQKVRLLNVDTPETKHPDKPVECLGLEATEKLESLTPPGTQVGLDFDVERTDRYDRVLAAVFIQGQTLVNAEIARVGLGVPMLIEPNRKYFDAVQAAYNEATEEGVGLLDPAAECTVPAELTDTIDALAAAANAPVGESSTAAAATAAGILAALTTAKALREALEAGKDTVRVVALGADRTAALLRDLDSRISDGERALGTANAKATTLKEAEAAAERERVEAEKVARAAAEEAKAAEAARVETERIQAEAAEAARIDAERVQAEANARAEADRLAAEAAAAAERERIQNLPPAPAPYVPPAPAPYVPPAPAPAPPAADPYPGYTGPRCYAPGGKTYRPC